jgi:formate/nitrite transporter
LPKGIAAGKVSTQQMLRNWAWVYVGNLAGCLFFAALFYVSMTNWGHPAAPVPGSTSPTLAQVITTGAVGKVTAYEALGVTGWFLAVVKAILANWMVTVGVLMAFVSRSVIGKVIAMWLPIMTFFALGLEHSIVNMFVIPLGMMLDAPISVGDWWLWNQIPVTLGNIVGGALLTGLAVYVTHRPKAE